MLGFLFGFNARISRLHYFLASVALGFVAALVTYAVVFHAMRPGAVSPQASAIAASWSMIILMVVFGFATFALQSMRFRDIGWDPVCVIPAWIAVLIIDAVLATKVPAWSLGPQHSHTAIGAAVNLGMFLALCFWPGGDFEAAPPRSDDPSPPPRARGDSGSVAATRIARVTGGTNGFGRRG
jgi:uncharacterized membrane protein YhaH (DUF805 family)